MNRSLFINACLVTLLTISGCNAVSPPEGVDESKLIQLGEMDNVKLNRTSVSRDNGFLSVKAEFVNIRASNQQFFYRFKWLDHDGFPATAEEAWKPVMLYGTQKTVVVGAIAPSSDIADYRIELQAPDNTINLLK